MTANTKIQWADHTFNPWRGCTKIAAGCANCYAEKLSHRNPGVLGIWGDDGTRVVAADRTWREPLKWAKAYREACGEGPGTVPHPHRNPDTCPDHFPGCPARARRPRVFCASLADVLESRDELDDVRLRLWALVLLTPELDWLLLTKRIGNARLPSAVADYHRINEHANELLRRGPGDRIAVVPTQQDGTVPDPFRDGWPRNVWWGVSVAEQKDADELIPLLLKVPASVRFVSYEPAISYVDFTPWLKRLDWIVMGGESGARAKVRPANVAWFARVAALCVQAGVAAFVKQLGARVAWNGNGEPFPPFVAVAENHADEHAFDVTLVDDKGGDPDEWPRDLRIRQHPESAAA